MKQPVISVVMSVYNGEAFLRQTMDSILRQTYPDWELVAVDDCSTDGSLAILSEYAARDARIRVLPNETNLRLQRSLNRAIDAARGEYMLRIDADDICRLDRFEKQLAFLRAHPELDMCASKFFLLIDGKIVPAAMTQRLDAASTAALLLFYNPICHPCVMMKLSVAKALRYRAAFTCSEDLELWTRMAAQGRKFALIGEPLVLYRRHAAQITQTTDDQQREQYRRIIEPFFTATLFPPSAEQLDFQAAGVYFRDRPDLARLRPWLRQIMAANETTRAFAPEAVKYAAFEILCEYRRLGLASVRDLLPLGALFVAKEFARRFARRLRDRALRDRRIALFQNQLKGSRP